MLVIFMKLFISNSMNYSARQQIIIVFGNYPSLQRYWLWGTSVKLFIFWFDAYKIKRQGGRTWMPQHACYWLLLSNLNNHQDSKGLILQTIVFSVYRTSILHKYTVYLGTFNVIIFLGLNSARTLISSVLFLDAV